MIVSFGCVLGGSNLFMLLGHSLQADPLERWKQANKPIFLSEKNQLIETSDFRKRQDHFYLYAIGCDNRTEGIVDDDVVEP